MGPPCLIGWRVLASSGYSCKECAEILEFAFAMKGRQWNYLCAFCEESSLAGNSGVITNIRPYAVN